MLEQLTADYDIESSTDTANTKLAAKAIAAIVEDHSTFIADRMSTFL